LATVVLHFIAKAMFALALLSIGLAADAFAAALSQGVTVRPTSRGSAAIAAAFGLAQAIMPLIGWGLGIVFVSGFREVDHWIALALLLFIGSSILREGWSREDHAPARPLRGWALLTAAIATSIDAAAAGITLPTLGQPVVVACAAIGLTTAALSFAGARLGFLIGAQMGRYAEILGGLLLIFLGLKIFVQHQFFGG
jgi:putative Mn2+ efflux pump MntP